MRVAESPLTHASQRFIQIMASKVTGRSLLAFWRARGAKFARLAVELAALVLVVFVASESWAAVAGQVSFTVGEEYNDNIYFTRPKDGDFITYFAPTFSLLYAPTGQTVPTLTADFTPIGQVFALHNRETNFADNLRFRTAYTYNYSPRLVFQAANTLRRLGDTRTGMTEGLVGGWSQTEGGVPSPPTFQDLGNFTTGGQQLTNQLALGGRYKYSDKVSFTSNYTFDYTSFIDQGGRDIWHSAGLRGVYNWRQEHNLYAGYTAEFIKSRNGDDNVVHNFDIGDDYFSLLKMDLTPTLTVLGSAGFAVNTRSGGPGVSSRVNLRATKLWERASLSAGVNKGLTPSFGVAGISDTTSLSSNFNIRLTEFLTGSAGLNYSFYDTDNGNFNTFQSSTGLQYQINSWLGANLSYAYRRSDSGSGAASSDLVTKGKVNSSSVFLSLTSRIDVWPTFGLSRMPFRP